MTGGSKIERVEGRAVVLHGADIDTDRIIPARFLKAVTFEGLGAQVFADDRAAARQAGRLHPFDDPAHAGASVLVVNANFGCGSSREHAPQALSRWGVRAIVGESFADIFFSNAVALGLPCVTAAPEDVARVQALVDEDERLTVSVDLAALAVSAGAFRAPIALPDSARQAFRSGQWDATGLLLENYAEVERVEAALPYRFGRVPPV